ncbi:hypothetical protein C8R46DRAFT_1360456 [Mycena filopes]|nr:hypothetical protein C8R46DRAFT_1360456 [Mycena filopes]
MTPPAGVECTHSSPSERDSLPDDRTRLAENKAKILELELPLSFLKQENDLIQDRLDAYAHPVLTLPNEILSEIFIQFLPVYPETPPIIGRSSPNVLGQICRKWRAIALSTPQLWRAISFSLANGKRLAQKIHLLETWLQRSGSCLLSLNMDLGTNTNAMQPFLVALAVQRVRWQHLRLHSGSAALPLLTDAALPFLRTVYIASNPIRIHREWMLQRDRSLVSAVRTASLLRTVAICYWHEAFTALYPWSQLTTFIGQRFLPRQCADFLAQAVNLVYLRLHVFPDGALVGPPHCGASANYTWNILDTLTIPALVTLQVSEYVFHGDSIARLQSLISRSGCTIQSLYITPSNLSPVLYRLALPTVEEFIFNVELPQSDCNPFEVPQDEESEAEECRMTTRMQMQNRTAAKERTTPSRSLQSM